MPVERTQNRDAMIIWLNFRQHEGNSLQTGPRGPG